LAVLVGTLPDRRRIEGCEGHNLAVAHIEVKGARVSLGQHVRGGGASARGVVATGVEQNEHLLDACRADTFVHTLDADRRVFEERNVVAYLRVRRKQICMPAALYAMTREGDEQQAVFGHKRD